jgi:hypothetical protein
VAFKSKSNVGNVEAKFTGHRRHGKAEDALGEYVPYASMWPQARRHISGIDRSSSIPASTGKSAV